MAGAVDVLNLVFALAFHVSEVFPQQINRYTYTFCGVQWNTRYPYLAEVRYSRPKTWYEHKYHQNRHGILITNRAVLTRAQDLDGYPDKNYKPPDMFPIAKEFLDCHTRRQFGAKACVYVNIRRPQVEGYIEGPYCGQNFVVRNVITHPKYGKTAYLPDLFNRRVKGTLRNHFQNIKFPFAVLILDKVAESTDPNQPFVPTAIFPRTPVDFLYWLRRVDTLGPTSKLCEYPTYQELKHEGWYSRYSRPDETIMKLRRSDMRDSDYVLCPNDWSLYGKGFESVTPRPSGRWVDQEYQTICNESLIETPFPYSFLSWLGTHGTFDERWQDRNGYWHYRKGRSDDRLGAPIVCDGITLGITSTWANRGRGKADVYIGTTLMRAYGWLIGNMINNSVRIYHRNSQDSPFLGELYRFKKKEYPTRKYDDDIFELSANERLMTFGGSGRIEVGLFGSLGLPILGFLAFRPI